MPQIQRSALVMYSAAQMYDLVNDVDSYPQFIPDCASSSIIESSDKHMVASLQISKGTLNKSFTTRNTLEENHQVKMELVEGPFDNLTGVWTFSPLDTHACKVELNLEFEFSNRLMDATFGKVFSVVASSMVKAFSERAKIVYGNN